jgi:hypothetical protein
MVIKKASRDVKPFVFFQYFSLGKYVLFVFPIIIDLFSKWV